MLTFVCWKWQQPGCRSTYNAKHVNVWANMIERSYKNPKRLICITDDPKGINIETFPLWSDHAQLSNPHGAHLPSCYRRLKIFSSLQTEAMGIEHGAEVVSLDLDIVVMNNITTLLDRVQANFAGWKRIGPQKPVGYNGSLFKFRTGTLDFLWDTFDPVQSPIRTRRAKQHGSDQAWISFNLDGNGPGWTQSSGIYSFTSDVQKRSLPGNARIIIFNGKYKPWDAVLHRAHPWIMRHWQ